MADLETPSNKVLKVSEQVPVKKRKMLTGIVTSDKMNKTVVLKVSRRVLEPRFGKYVTKRAKYKAHCEDNNARIGDTVVISESRPLSKDKRWRVIRVFSSAQSIDKKDQNQENSL